MRKFGLIGYPLGHSFSQKFFSEKFQKEHIEDCVYENFPLSSIDMLPAMIISQPDLCGLNVTIPYKEKVISFLDDSDEIVKKINACNCIDIHNGKLYGFNTDVPGFEESLKRKLQAHHNKALILGTGGASKAVEYVISKMGIEYKLVSRKPDSSSVSHIGYAQLTDDLIDQYKLIINTTPLGMFPNLDRYPPLPYGSIASKHYLFDLIYNPAKTMFLQKGEAQGAMIQNGSEMLILQAEESWKIWNRNN
ncbi:MAG TPA: shikimate dehydrogenase [Puia sp.]|nr:shikimate dehydrogenase [Puia sp.]